MTSRSKSSWQYNVQKVTSFWGTQSPRPYQAPLRDFHSPNPRTIPLPESWIRLWYFYLFVRLMSSISVPLYTLSFFVSSNLTYLTQYNVQKITSYWAIKTPYTLIYVGALPLDPVRDFYIPNLSDKTPFLNFLAVHRCVIGRIQSTYYGRPM